MTMNSGTRLDVLALARENDAFRRVIASGPHSQLVVMTIPPGGEIGEEVHEHVDQILLFVEGEAKPCSRGSGAPWAQTTSSSSRRGLATTS